MEHLRIITFVGMEPSKLINYSTKICVEMAKVPRWYNRCTIFSSGHYEGKKLLKSPYLDNKL
jgi:hypothetical protein